MFVAGGCRSSRARAGAALLLLTSWPSAAFAGAWTMPEGAGQVIATLFGWTGAGAPYGGGGPAPKESRVEAQTYAEYGLTNRLTIFGEASIESYRLSAPSADSYRGLDYSDLGLRTKLWSNDTIVFSAEATAFLPGARDAARPAQAGDTGGAGEARALAGYNFKVLGTPGFVDAEVGYRLRAAGPPDEWHIDATLGLKPTARLTLMLQSFNTIAPSSQNTMFPAWRSDVGEISVVYALDERWSLQVGAFASFSTVNTNSQRGVLAAVWRKF